MQNPDGYWCVRDDDRVLYFWHERPSAAPVGREEYLVYSGKEDCV
jgi:hypothetical protein